MKKYLACVLLLGGTFAAPLAWGNSFFNRAPQFTTPDGPVAFLGCYWSPLTIRGDGSPSSAPPMPSDPNTNTTVYQSGNVQLGVNGGALGQMFANQIIGQAAPPTSAQAMADTDQAVVEKSNGLGLPLMPVDYNTAYQNALLMHVLAPARWGYNPGITTYCGGKPYILIGIIDYDGPYPSSVKISGKQNDQPVNYWGKRSMLEQDTDIFANKGAQHAVALEFFLISTTDGTTLWQANLMTTSGTSAGYDGIAAGLVENALKDLYKK